MIHGTCCGQGFNCLEIYSVLHWSIDGVCPWCRIGTSSRLTDFQLSAVCTHMRNGWHPLPFRNPGLPRVLNEEGLFINCSTEILRSLDHLDPTARVWQTDQVPQDYPALTHPFPDLPETPILFQIETGATTSAKQLGCRCNNCG